MLRFERRVLSILENMWYSPCDASLKIERAGASPGKARFVTRSKNLWLTNTTVLRSYSICSSNVSCSMPFLRWQQGQRWRRRTIPTISSLCSVAIEVGLCRSGRTGGSSGSSTSGNSRFLESRLVSSSLRGEKATLRDQKGVGGYAHRRVVMKPAPLAPFVMPQADLLFELFVIALDSPAQLGEVDQ